MIKKKLDAISDRIDDGLRSLAARISPDGRIIIILIMLLLFGGGSFYMAVSSIYNMGKSKGKEIQIEHIRQLDIEQQQQADSINHKNNFNYE